MENKIKELVLEGLNCAGCAAKIETQVKNMPEVAEASLNLMNNILRIRTVHEGDLKEVVSRTIQIVNRLEPHVKVYEKVEDKSDSAFVESEYATKRWLTIGGGTALFLMALLAPLPEWIQVFLYVAAYAIVGGEIILKAVKNIFRGQIFDENFLMALATMGAFAIKEYPEAIGVMLFYQIGETLQDMAVNRSKKSIQSLMDIRPEYANLKQEGHIVQVDPQQVEVGDIIVIKPGERVPLDGVVIEGEALFDTSALTGESVPRRLTVGESVLAGVINQNGVVTIEVTHRFTESTLAKIFDLVQNAAAHKAPTENFITKFARYYTPAIVVSALAVAVIPPILFADASFAEWFYRSLIFLVISCPCALVVSIPLGFFGGIGGAARQGVLVKGGNYLEALNKVDTVVFDKTGTLTKGVFNVVEKHAETGFSDTELLKWAALAEAHSNHPIAKSIKQAYNDDVDLNLVETYEEISGCGIKTIIGGRQVWVGNSRLMVEGNISFIPVSTYGTVIYVAVDQQYAGYIVIADELKEDAAATMDALRQSGVNRIVMLTGDRRAVAEHVARDLNMDDFYAELLPQQKVEQVEILKERTGQTGKLIFVGDGINDAPVLARADVGIAMGGIGSDAAIEAADVVLMNDELSNLVTAFEIAIKTKRIVWQNIIFSLGVKGLILTLGVLGFASMWAAVFADVGVALIAVLNSIRTIRFEPK